MELSSRKILLLFAHPSLDRSQINRKLFEASQEIEGVTCVDLYYEYPRYHIDVDREQQRLREHEVVIFMFPLYWYSTPSILKEWQDLVLEYGFAYGANGWALQGKLFLCALTAGAPESAFRAGGENHYRIEELLRPIEQMAVTCRMQYLPPFALFDAIGSAQSNRIQQHVRQWQAVLRGLREHRFELSEMQAGFKLNDIVRQPMDPEG
ncbi:NAD(P)H-dependent oxidoreductase [Dongshaea marina]|uniref:NAD(P)H-dependent oxidoreductase n=1 Tax=Dongshaea marina TaxID=2047966 RepID=UPI000D3EC03B|nr:NAD(P)H-dependent oxidoreductase [Dongshaea marina]